MNEKMIYKEGEDWKAISSEVKLSEEDLTEISTLPEKKWLIYLVTNIDEVLHKQTPFDAVIYYAVSIESLKELLKKIYKKGTRIWIDELEIIASLEHTVESENKKELTTKEYLEMTGYKGFPSYLKITSEVPDNFSLKAMSGIKCILAYDLEKTTKEGLWFKSQIYYAQNPQILVKMLETDYKKGTRLMLEVARPVTPYVVIIGEEKCK